MEKYLEEIIQNKDINCIQVYFGFSSTPSIFKITDIESSKLVAKFNNYSIKQIKARFYQAGNKIKLGNNYFKLVQIENNDIVKDNVFKLTPEGETEALFILFNKQNITVNDFPCKMEYAVEKDISVIEIDYTETIKIKIEDEKTVTVEIIKDAYIDNTIREFMVLIKELQWLFTGNTCN
tara:strand:+ start:561 stop:1097 length:537 start_codon:yes stop_codon:yes gene_type:complete